LSAPDPADAASSLLSGLPAIAEFLSLCTVSDSCTCSEDRASGTVTLAKRLADQC